MILISNCRIVDPSQNLDKGTNILIKNNKIHDFPRNIDDLKGRKDIEIINADGFIVSPGFIDLHVHLREPGYEYKETIKTGCLSAAAGGFTSIVCMPNTNPINDNASVTEFIMLKARTEGMINVFPVGAITKDEKGEALANIGEMYEAGCVGISDDGMPVMNSKIMRLAMEYVRAFDIPVFSHSEDINLSSNGVMNEGKASTMLGLRGIPSASEDIMVARDIKLAELTGAHLHILHVSTAGSVEMVRDAKRKGINVTCEVTPHHFTLTEEAIQTSFTMAKMNPPLRTKHDIEAIYEGLSDNTIDAIATDHAPHSEDEKKVEFDLSPFGIVGLETALPLSLTLVEKGIITLNQLITKLTYIPSDIAKLNKGTLKKGSVADIAIFDPGEEVIIDRNNFLSKGKNSPFDGWNLKGRVKYTISNGKIAYKA
ncbi:MAG: dihydroorotase [Thermodesulfobacteriota bacterium]